MFRNEMHAVARFGTYPIVDQRQPNYVNLPNYLIPRAFARPRRYDRLTLSLRHVNSDRVKRDRTFTRESLQRQRLSRGRIYLRLTPAGYLYFIFWGGGGGSLNPRQRVLLVRATEKIFRSKRDRVMSLRFA